VANLRVAGQGEVLAEGMALETVVGHDASQIGVAGKEDAEHVVHLTLEPVGTGEASRDAGHGGCLVRVRLDSAARVVPDREQVVGDLQTAFAGREMGTGDGAQLCKLGRGVIWARLESCVGKRITWIPTLQELEDGDDARGGNVDGEFILPDGELLDV